MSSLAESLSPSMRAQRYREFAAETLQLAHEADVAETKATYLSLAACWSNLADKAEQTVSSEYPDVFEP